MTERHEVGSAHFYAIEVGGHAAGQCSLHDQGDGVGEIGYWIRTDLPNGGLATSAVLAVTRAAFGAGYQRLIIHCDAGNARSAAVARKAGYLHAHTVVLDPDRPRTFAQSGREMTWVRDRPPGLP